MQRLVMDVIFTQVAEARIIALQDKPVPFWATLRYSSTDPLAIHVSLPDQATWGGWPRTWVFARDLLSEGLNNDAGSGSVRIWSCCPSGTVLEFHSAGEILPVQFRTTVLAHFLRCSYALVAPGHEDVGGALERSLDSVVGDGPVQRE
jgi:hypothetical protein